MSVSIPASHCQKLLVEVIHLCPKCFVESFGIELQYPLSSSIDIPSCYGYESENKSFRLVGKISVKTW